MKTVVMLLVLSTPAFAQDRAPWMKDAKKEVSLNITSEPEHNGIIRVKASPDNPISLNTNLRMATTIVLPTDEKIMDISSGNPMLWSIDAHNTPDSGLTAKNIVYVRPKQPGFDTNLVIVTESATTYLFLLHQTTKQPDLMVYVASYVEKPPQPRRYVPIAEHEAVQAELVTARTLLDSERKRSEEQIAVVKSEAPEQMHFDYRVTKTAKTFTLKEAWHDTSFTYIEIDAREKPALYELKDDRPSIVNFQVKGKLYVVPKVLDKAYFALGKERLDFEQVKGN